ncbi:Mrp/NBP35 family ATP-binding protein [Sporolactobacillus laevolacticus]|uniref:Iron-sulfur cluster carrier protein n=1 Tax=Sporolactobacillus laevolacticus DSM 442 TaxID=1395513 RepID=V6IUE2_9BACL|nr:Mrp/NBP35 family ATP-binding protein [Sporolactobacillus laevolacticus]EST10575.1 chromosome partitioning protein ParA [Sporolactobacillus laevolacticus DSM 442]
MMDQQKVLDVLKTVQDPFLHKNLLETQALKKLSIEDGRVRLEVALSKQDKVKQMQIQVEISSKLKEQGAESVIVRFGVLSEQEIHELGGFPNARPTLLSPGTKTEFIAVASGKGGVGKSTVSVNLALALARQGKKVGLLDADIYGFSVPDMMGIENRPAIQDEKIMPVERFGLKVISMGFFVENNSPVIWRGPMLGKMLNNFFNDVDWGELDYLVLDLPPGTGDVAMDIHNKLPHSKEIIVTTPHPTAAFVAARAGAMATQTKHEILGVIENMAYYQSKKTGEIEYVFGKGGGDKLSDLLKTDLLGRVPLTQPAQKKGVFAPGVYFKDDPIAPAYDDIAIKVINKLSKN